MGLDIKVTSEDYLGSEDRRWLGTRLGTQDLRSITLDASAFSSYHVTEYGAVPSGTVLGKITASGLYGPYGGASEEVQTLTLGGAGLTSFTITYSGQTTASLAAAATAAQVQQALEDLSNLAPGDVVVTGGPLATGPFTLTFGGTLKDTNVAQVTTTPTGGTGVVNVATTVSGGVETGTGGLETAAGILFTKTKLGSGSGADLATAGDVGAALFWMGVVKTAYLPTFVGGNAGVLDANAQTDLGNFIRFE